MIRIRKRGAKRLIRAVESRSLHHRVAAVIRFLVNHPEVLMSGTRADDSKEKRAG